MTNILIIAGGIGTRFWPKSTEKKPKQFINLLGDRTMLQMTVDRVKKIVGIKNIFISTNSQYRDLVIEQIPELDKENIIIEPLGRNTAPCILLSTMKINKRYPGSDIVVLPADHIINNEKNFIITIKKGIEFLKNNRGIVTIGIQPTRPETGYGYIKIQKALGDFDISDVIKVEKFVEKPNLEKAKEYLNEKNYLWNAGMFIYNSEFMIKSFQEEKNEMYEIISEIVNSKENEYEEILYREYEKCEKISIDYAIIEKSSDIYVIPANLGWDDIGTWTSLQRYLNEDKNSNIVHGEVILENCQNCVVYGNGKKVILINMKDLFVIDSDEAIVVGNKNDLPKVHSYKERD